MISTSFRNNHEWMLFIFSSQWASQGYTLQWIWKIVYNNPTFSSQKFCIKLNFKCFFYLFYSWSIAFGTTFLDFKARRKFCFSDSPSTQWNCRHAFQDIGYFRQHFWTSQLTEHLEFKNVHEIFELRRSQRGKNRYTWSKVYLNHTETS